MAAHEVPYLARPEVLEYPTETWAAQDLRKAEVLWWAAGHAGAEERDVLLKRAGFFFDDAVRTLSAGPTRHFTRPVVLLLSNGIRAGWVARRGPLSVPFTTSVSVNHRRPASFEPQKLKAIRRAKWLAIGGLVVVLLLVLGQAMGAR
jgi:hypothetical protein